jgi:hypothetical protein
MAQSAKSLMRAGLISPKASAKLAVLRGTRSQKGKMTDFDHSFRDEGRLNQPGGHGHFGRNQIARGQHGKGMVGRGQEMPSRSRAGRSETGGAEHKGGSYFPGKNQIDEFPQKQNRTWSPANRAPTGAGAFPAGTNLGKRSGFKDLNAKSRGGKQNYRGNSYGSPNSRP